MSSPSPELLLAWRAGHGVPGVNFAHDDLVTLLGGEHAGNVGAVVTIRQLEPEVVYDVEIDTNFIVSASQAEIALAD